MVPSIDSAGWCRVLFNSAGWCAVWLNGTLTIGRYYG